MYNRFRRCGNQYCNNPALEYVCDDIDNENTNNCCNTNCCEMNKYNCGCGFDEAEQVFPINPMLAQSYVPVQRMNKTFTPCCGLKNGTIFPELVSPYEPCDSMEFINYLKARNKIGEGCNG